MNLKTDSATTIRQGEELNIDNLNAFIKKGNFGIDPIIEVAQFPGGYSNLTYLLKTKSSEYVLRRPPFGAKDIKGGHDMNREYKILAALENSRFHQIPKPIVFCDDEEVLDCPFYIMERVEGIILRANHAKKLVENIDKEGFKKLSEALCDNLVALHSIDIESTGLINIGKPEGYIRRQVEGWQKRYVASETNEIEAMNKLANWLIINLPKENKPTLLHNDYKYDNVVLSPNNTTEIIAILDWEMSTVGDPLMDVGTCLSYWSEASDGAFEKSFNITWIDGNLTRQAFADRYAEKSGRDLSNILYYYVFGLFKNAVVMQQIYARFKKGLTKDERFGQLINGVRALAHKGNISIEENRMA